MTDTPLNEQTQSDQPRITRARVDSLCIYEITEGELGNIEQGSPASIYLNFAIALLSLSASFLVTLFTVPIESTTKFIIFLVVAITTLISGVVLFVLWFRSKDLFAETIAKIKQRKPPDGTSRAEIPPVTGSPSSATTSPEPHVTEM